MNVPLNHQPKEFVIHYLNILFTPQKYPQKDSLQEDHFKNEQHNYSPKKTVSVPLNGWAHQQKVFLIQYLDILTCPRSVETIYIVTFNIEWAKTSWITVRMSYLQKEIIQK